MVPLRNIQIQYLLMDQTLEKADVIGENEAGHTIIFNKIHIQQLQVIHVQPCLKNVLMRLGSHHWIGGQLQLKIVLGGYHYLQIHVR